MRPGMECVLQLLRGECSQRSLTLAEFQNAFAVADQEHVLPSFLARIRAGDPEVTQEATEQIRRAERDIALSSFWWTSELKGILQGFAAERLELILLKGPSLAKRLYGDASLRVCRDLDLLVRRSEAEAAGSLLTKLGFTPNDLPEDYQHAWQRGTTLVELHVDVENPLAIDFDVAAAWSRTEAAEFAGQPVRIFAPIDELLFLCLHGARHRYERLSHILDVVLAFKSFGPRIEPAAWASGSAARLLHLVVLGWAMARRLDPRCELPIGLPVDARTAARMERIADRLWTAQLERPAAPFDWRAKHNFYLELEPWGVRRLTVRMRHLRILASRLIDADFAFAKKLGVTNFGLVWILRQFRLLLMFCGMRRWES